MDNALKTLIELSQTVGRNAQLVRGGGGNISFKTDDGQYMYIKASGAALKDLNEQFGWRRLQLEQARSILTDPALAGLTAMEQEEAVYRNLILSCRDEMPLDWAPSVESHLHAVLGRCVIHLHPVAVSAYGNAKNGPAALQRLFAGEKYPPLYMSYCNPGFTFARKLAGAIVKYRKVQGREPQIIFHEKHGVFISADSAKEGLGVLQRVVKGCEAKLPALKRTKPKPVVPGAILQARQAIRQACFKATGQYLPVTWHTSETIDGFCRRPDGRQLMRLPLAPDELSYASGPALWFDEVNADKIAVRLKGLIESGCQPAASFIIRNLGLFVAAECDQIETIRTIAENSMTIRSYAAKLGGVTGLTAAQRRFVEAVEAGGGHSHSCGCSPLLNRIAIVTGAGSGLGRSIAMGLAEAGAMVALADIDEAACRETAALIEKELPGTPTLALKCNVTSEESVQAGFRLLLDTWGGLDILVNAAGVAPAYPLVDFPVDKWRFALEVNLTGYFLMAREAARIMITQGMEGSIINLSSKSGLEASKNNTPYNATKAGEIHMARGWALELGQYGIRVNSVCPGNVFEGSKIWNPTYIKECAVKNGIKPEEVIPYYVNKTTLRKEIKGHDIADGIVFLCSDNARTVTGQTLVIDSGQVMVR